MAEESGGVVRLCGFLMDGAGSVSLGMGDDVGMGDDEGVNSVSGFSAGQSSIGTYVDPLSGEIYERRGSSRAKKMSEKMKDSEMRKKLPTNAGLPLNAGFNRGVAAMSVGFNQLVSGMTGNPETQPTFVAPAPIQRGPPINNGAAASAAAVSNVRQMGPGDGGIIPIVRPLVIESDNDVPIPKLLLGICQTPIPFGGSADLCSQLRDNKIPLTRIDDGDTKRMVLLMGLEKKEEVYRHLLDAMFPDDIDNKEMAKKMEEQTLVQGRRGSNAHTASDWGILVMVNFVDEGGVSKPVSFQLFQINTPLYDETTRRYDIAPVALNTTEFVITSQFAQCLEDQYCWNFSEGMKHRALCSLWRPRLACWEVVHGACGDFFGQHGVQPVSCFPIKHPMKTIRDPETGKRIRDELTMPFKNHHRLMADDKARMITTNELMANVFNHRWNEINFIGQGLETVALDVLVNLTMEYVPGEYGLTMTGPNDPGGGGQLLLVVGLKPPGDVNAPVQLYGFPVGMSTELPEDQQHDNAKKFMAKLKDMLKYLPMVYALTQSCAVWSGERKDLKLVVIGNEKFPHRISLWHGNADHLEEWNTLTWDKMATQIKSVLSVKESCSSDNAVFLSLLRMVFSSFTGRTAKEFAPNNANAMTSKMQVSSKTSRTQTVPCTFIKVTNIARTELSGGNPVTGLELVLEVLVLNPGDDNDNRSHSNKILTWRQILTTMSALDMHHWNKEFLSEFGNNLREMLERLRNTLMFDLAKFSRGCAVKFHGTSLHGPIKALEKNPIVVYEVSTKLADDQVRTNYVVMFPTATDAQRVRIVNPVVSWVMWVTLLCGSNVWKKWTRVDFPNDVVAETHESTLRLARTLHPSLVDVVEHEPDAYMCSAKVVNSTSVQCKRKHICASASKAVVGLNIDNQTTEPGDLQSSSVEDGIIRWNPNTDDKKAITRIQKMCANYDMALDEGEISLKSVLDRLLECATSTQMDAKANASERRVKARANIEMGGAKVLGGRTADSLLREGGRGAEAPRNQRFQLTRWSDKESFAVQPAKATVKSLRPEEMCAGMKILVYPGRVTSNPHSGAREAKVVSVLGNEVTFTYDNDSDDESKEYVTGADRCSKRIDGQSSTRKKPKKKLKGLPFTRPLTRAFAHLVWAPPT
jgi:hypothetical protein